MLTVAGRQYLLLLFHFIFIVFTMCMFVCLSVCCRCCPCGE